MLRRLRDSDKRAFSEIYSHYRPLLYSFALRYTKNSDDTEDIIHDVFVKLWDVRRELFLRTMLKSYLYTMTKNAVLNYIRNRSNALRHNYNIAQQRGYSDDDLYMYAERNHKTELLQAAVLSLPPRQQEIALLRMKGYSNAEIASMLGLSLNTVNAHYRTIVAKLREQLDK